MTVFSTYVLLDDGKCIFSWDFVPNPPSQLLVTGLLAAMQNFVEEVSNSYVSNFTTGDYTFHCQKVGPIMVVLSTSTLVKTNEEIIYKLQQLAIRFINKYGSMDDWDGDTEPYLSFKDDVLEIMGETFMKNREVYPLKPLDSFTLITVEKGLQNTAQSVLQTKEGTVESIAKVANESIEETKNNLEKLVEMGHIGKYQRGKRWYYFIL